MYYITNQKDQIIAMDEALLKLLGFDTIENLQKKLAREELSFVSSFEELTINTDAEQHTFECETTTLISMFGELSLHVLKSKTEEEGTVSDESKLADEALAAALRAEEEHEALIALENEPLTAIEELEEKESEEPLFSLEEEPLFIMDEEEKIEVAETEDTGISILEEPEEVGISILEEPEEPLIALDEEPFSIIDEEENIETGISILEEPEEKESEKPLFSLEEEPLFILDEEEKIEVAETEDTGISILEEPEESEKELDIGIVDELEETLTHEETVPEAQPTKETNLTPILVDIEKLSHTIGLSKDDYTTFLHEFIDEALSLEKDLQSFDLQKQSEAIKTLKQLASALHLSEITDAVHKIEESTSEEKVEQIETLYNTLTRLTPASAEKETLLEKIENKISIMEPEEEMIPEVAEPTLNVEEEVEPMPMLEIEPEEKPEVELEIEAEPAVEPVGEAQAEEELPEGSFGSLTMEDLDAVRPIHFDFRLEEAAGELSLPVELIEEFVNDFLVQAREETVNILEAYREGNLDRIQKIGHLLKGASSNLRINPLADTLYEIQFCEDPSQLESLIKHYWAHFISFEKQMHMTSK